MNNELTIFSGLQSCFGISVSNDSKDSGNSILIDDKLYKTIEATLKNEFGETTTALKMTIDPEKYRKYYDGTYSSMINDAVSNIKHKGFEGVDLINLAKNIYDGVNKNLSQEILQKYNQSLLNIFSSVINNTQHEVGDIMISEHLAEIESYKLLYEDLQEDINDIMITPSRRIAYLNAIVNSKVTLYKNFIFLVGRLKHLNNTTNNCYQYTPSETELQNILLKISFLIRLYLNNCIYEYVLAGNYTESPKERIKYRCKEMEKKLVDTLESLKQKYNNIFNIFDYFISGSYSNGFFVKNYLNNFNKNELLLDYTELENLDRTITINFENIKIISSREVKSSIPNT